ncbi:hypothetical protein ANANG_G00283670, partial [Anguilla anguilla]
GHGLRSACVPPSHAAGAHTRLAAERVLLWRLVAAGHGEGQGALGRHGGLGNERRKRVRAGPHYGADRCRGRGPAAHGCQLNAAIPSRRGGTPPAHLRGPGLLLYIWQVEDSCRVP